MLCGITVYTSVKQGFLKNAVYAGIPELLAELRQGGNTLGVATSKPEVFAKQILEHFFLDGFFHLAVGSNLDGSMVEKAEVVACVLEKLGPSDLGSVVMVGDRKHDIVGAKEKQH